MSDDYRLLITGSRKATPEMLDYARRAVARAKEHGWHIVVGDAEGVDLAVMQACDALGVPYVCYGIDPQPRHGNPAQYVRCEGTFLDRDRVMARICHRVLAIWNGHSQRSGTIATWNYARNDHKPGELVNFGKPDNPIHHVRET